jgi:hypothetical protein
MEEPSMDRQRQRDRDPGQGEVSQVGGIDQAALRAMDFEDENDGTRMRVLVTPNQEVVGVYTQDGINLAPAVESGPHLNDPEVAAAKQQQQQRYESLVASLPTTADVPRGGERD